MTFLKSFKMMFVLSVITVVGLMASHMQAQQEQLDKANEIIQELHRSHLQDKETIARLDKALADYSAQLKHLRDETDKLKSLYESSNKTLKKRLVKAKEIQNPVEQMNTISEILFDDIAEFKAKVTEK